MELPASVDALRDAIISGNAGRFGTHANVHARLAVDDYIREEKWLGEIEAQWGPAPGRQQSDGSSILVLGARFGNVFVGIQPAFGYEGDPMRLLFEKGFAPTHAFSAFYRWLRKEFGAHAVLHFGTHGALEFMPGKQVGMSAACWPDRLIGDLPNLYLYASNNPSEGTIAKRRSGATLISYLTPPISHAGLYRGLLELKASIERWRGLAPDAAERGELAALIQSQAAAVDLGEAEPPWDGEVDRKVVELARHVLELEYTLIPHGLHVVGVPPSAEERVDMLLAIAESLARAAARARLDRERSSAVKQRRALSARRRDPMMGSSLRSIVISLRIPSLRPFCMRSMAGLFVPLPAAISCARRRFCRPGGTCTASIRSGSRVPSRSAMGPGRRRGCSIAISPTIENSRIPWPSCCGARTTSRARVVRSLRHSP